MKNTTLYALLTLVCTLFAQEAFAQVEKYVVRNEVTRQRFFYPEQEQMFRKAVDLLDASKRVEVIGEQDQSTVATHLLEVESSIGQDFTINITFVDSISTANIRMSQQATGKVTMLTTDISSGMLAGNTVLNCSGISTKDVKHKYADIGWVKGSKYQDKVKDEVDARIKNRYAKEIVAMENDARKKMADNLTGDPAYKLFPFRLTILEVAETDDDEAEKVIISAGTNADISKRDRLVVYSVNESTSGKRKFEHFESVGRLKFESDHAKGGFCDVARGKKDILAAIKAGKTLYCTPGYTPYTKRDNSSALKLAIAVQYPREATEGAQNQFYRRVRMDLSQ
ncbi:MAG: hypothetical protein IT269_06580, partial [Saprospiraceae bacterium]|nr:hypothetical protein [Saprospiraceae bacterium]